MALDHASVQSCYFPAIGSGSGSDKTRPLSVRVAMQHPELLQQLLLKHAGRDLLVTSVTAAWALVLRTYTGLDQVCFGFSEVGGTSAKRDENGQRDSIATHAVRDEVLLGEIARPAQNDGSVDGKLSHENFAYNTSVLFRFAAQDVTSGSSTVMSTTMAESVS